MNRAKSVIHNALEPHLSQLILNLHVHVQNDAADYV